MQWTLLFMFLEKWPLIFASSPMAASSPQTYGELSTEMTASSTVWGSPVTLQITSPNFALKFSYKSRCGYKIVAFLTRSTLKKEVDCIN